MQLCGEICEASQVSAVMNASRLELWNYASAFHVLLAIALARELQTCAGGSLESTGQLEECLREIIEIICRRIFSELSSFGNKQ